MEKDSNSQLAAWQIGSKRPPKVCLCCGASFDSERRITGPHEGPYIWVCSVCWSLPTLFFADKVVSEDGSRAMPLDVP